MEIVCYLLVISSVLMPWLFLQYIFEFSSFSDNPLNQDSMVVLPALGAISTGIAIYCFSVILSLTVAFLGLKKRGLLLLLVVFNVLLSVALPSVILHTFPKQIGHYFQANWIDYVFMSLFIQALIIVPLIAAFYRLFSIYAEKSRDSKKL